MMTNIKYHSVGTFPKSNRKIVERSKVDTPSTHIYDPLLPWLGTGTSIKGGGDELMLWAKSSFLKPKKKHNLIIKVQLLASLHMI